ncbi:unnamed protein product [Jaminaea pallidilutea]
MSTKKNIDGEEVLPGHRGNLDDDQQKALREMYRRFFELTTKNVEVSEELEKKGGPNKATGGGSSKAASGGKDEKEAGKDIPKGDAAKEEAKKQEEMKEMNQFLDKYGGPYLKRAVWEFCKHDHPDASFLRFLRARKWDVDRALAMLAAALKFRFDMDVEGIITKGELGLKDVPGFLNQFRRGISYIQGNSNAPGEYPIYFIHVARHFTNAQKHEVLQQFVLLAMENARQLTTPPYEKAVIVFDMNGFGLKNMDWQCVLFLVKCLEAYYPESLQRIYVHGAPWIFKGIWQVLQPMLDPVVRDKIKFSSKAHELADYIPAEKLRLGMGGTMDWDWDYIEPDPHENDHMKDTETVDAIKKQYMDLATKYEDLTKEWIEAGDTDDDAPDLTHQREVVAKQLRLCAFQGTPYLRAKNIYQRAGILKEEHHHTWEYPQKGGKTVTQTVGDRHDIPTLKKWLQDNDEDDLTDTVVGRLGLMGTESSGGKGSSGKKGARKGSQKSESKPSKDTSKEASKDTGKSSKDEGAGDQKKSKAAAGGAVGGLAAGAGAMAGKLKKGKKKEPEPEPEPEPEEESEEEESEEESEEEEEEDEEEEQKPSEKSASRGANGSARNGDAKKANEGQEGDDSQTYTGAAVGAATGAAAAVGATAAGAVSYLRGGNQEENGGEPDKKKQSYREPQQQDEDEEDYDEDGDEDEGLEDEDDMSDYSDDSITPETNVDLAFVNPKGVKAADVKIDDNDCREDLATVREAMNLFLNSRMREAEELCREGAENRLYKAEGMALINTVKAVMTFEPHDFETAIVCCKHSMNIASHLRKKTGAIGKLVGGGKQKMYQKMSLVEQHAELVFAESQLLKCVLGIFYAGDAVAFVKHAFGLRNSYFVMRDLLEFVEYCDGEAEEAQITGRRANVTVDQDFRSGVYVGNATCSLVLSMLPQRALKIMEGFGFVGDRKFSLDLYARAGGWTKNKPLPTISAEAEGVRRPLCDLAILVYHLTISNYIPLTDVDFEFADKILSWNLVRYPNGIFYLYFSARLYCCQALPEKAIEYFRNAIESQREYKQLHHMCFWDLALTYLATCDYARAHECYDVLSRESNWSKAIYQYAKAVMLYETGMDDRAKSATVMRTVPKLVKKVAGRQIPFEQFAVLRAKKYINNSNRLPLPALEFSYLWHCMGNMPIFLMVEQTLTRIDEYIDELETYHEPKSFPGGETEFYGAYCIAYFLRGVALGHVAYPPPHTLVRLPADDSIGSLDDVEKDAVGSFEKVFKWAHKLDEVDRYVCYFAHYEFGRLLAAMNKGDAARTEFRKVLSGKPLEAKGKGNLATGQKASYLMSNMCQVRSHAAMETMRIQSSRSRGSFFSSDSSSAAGSSIGGSLTSRSASMSSRDTSASSSRSRTSGKKVSRQGTGRSSRSSRASEVSGPTDYTSSRRR